MILAFEFEYGSNNDILERLLCEIATDFAILHAIQRTHNTITLFAEDNEERLGAFADTLATMLPLSIFFKSTNVFVAPNMPQDGIVRTHASCEDIVFTPKHLAFVDETLSPSLRTIGFDMYENETLIAKGVTRDERGSLYEKLVDTLVQGHFVKVCYRNETYTIAPIEAYETVSQTGDAEVIATDLSALERMVVIRDNEIKALATLERPALRLKVNAVFAQKSSIASRVWIRLANDLFLYQLSKALQNRGVAFLVKTTKPCESSSVSVVIDDNTIIDTRRICVFENGEIVVLKDDTVPMPEALQKIEEPSHRAFASIMHEHRIFENVTTCFYLSCTHDDRIMQYSKEHGMLNLVSFPLPASYQALFEEIEHTSASAKRLVENYRTQFPDLYAKALATPIPENLPKSVFSLWNIASLLLGLCDVWEEGAQKLIENAEDFGGQKGPRIDYYLQKEDALISDFNYLRLIRSAMSFKLAGTDDVTLSFGFMESLAYFISDISDAHKENMGCEKIALGGLMFGLKRFSEMVIKNIKPNHTICMNQELPIDG